MHNKQKRFFQSKAILYVISSSWVRDALILTWYFCQAYSGGLFCFLFSEALAQKLQLSLYIITTTMK